MVNCVPRYFLQLIRTIKIVVSLNVFIMHPVYIFVIPWRNYVVSCFSVSKPHKNRVILIKIREKSIIPLLNESLRWKSHMGGLGFPAAFPSANSLPTPSTHLVNSHPKPFL